MKVVGQENDFNVELEKALRLADFLKLGELMAATPSTARSRAAATSAGTPDRERAKPSATTRTSYTPPFGSARAVDQAPELTKEPLNFEFVHPAQRNYKD